MPDDAFRTYPLAVATLKEPSNERVAFGAALRSARTAAGLTQEELAEAMALGGERGRGQSTLAQWEQGRSAPQAHQVFELERILAVKPGSLSKLLGFLPVAAVRSVCDVKTAIAEDPRLDDESRKILELTYRKLVSGAGTRRGRPRKEA